MIGNMSPTGIPRSLVSTALASLSALVLAGCNAAPERTVSDDYLIFQTPATQRDVPEMAHTDDLLGELNIPVEEVRWVGSHETTDFFAALVRSKQDTADHVLCFFVLAHELEVAGASCSPDPYSAGDPTVSVRVAGTGGAVQAFLIPAATTLETADGWHRASDHVVVLTDRSAQPELTGTVYEESDITLRRMTG